MPTPHTLLEVKDLLRAVLQNVQCSNSCKLAALASVLSEQRMQEATKEERCAATAHALDQLCENVPPGALMKILTTNIAAVIGGHHDLYRNEPFKHAVLGMLRAKIEIACKFARTLRAAGSAHEQDETEQDERGS